MKNREAQLFLSLIKLAVGVTVLSFVVMFLWNFFNRETNKYKGSPSTIPSGVRNRNRKSHRSLSRTAISRASTLASIAARAKKK
tara:strand:+ start:2771 stop:3022 length:252 start_codon:yes stop_codon:yes gene_type:complete